MSEVPSMKKTRCDSKLEALPEEQRAKLVEWLLRNMGLHTIVALVKKEFGVDTGTRALSEFHTKWIKPILKDNIRNGAKNADIIAAEMSKRPDRYTPAIIKRTKQLALDLLSSPNPDPKDLKALLDPILKSDAQDLDRAKFQFDAVEAVKKHADIVREVIASGATESEKTDRIGRAIFGEKWDAK